MLQQQLESPYGEIITIGSIVRLEPTGFKERHFEMFQYAMGLPGEVTKIWDNTYVRVYWLGKTESYVHRIEQLRLADDEDTAMYALKRQGDAEHEHGT